MDISFILCVRLESAERINNFIYNIDYLCKNCIGANIFILESDETSKVPKLLPKIKHIDHCNINYTFLKSTSELFHKTKYINILSKKVETNVVVNYDIDIILNPQAYLSCYQLIKTGYDLIYPYKKGDYLVNVKPGQNLYERFWSNIPKYDIELKVCRYGLCQFMNTDSFLSYGSMNENFISYGPEDKELGVRFEKLRLRLDWTNYYIVHFDHPRGINSAPKHYMANKNYELFDKINSMTFDQIKHYYSIKK